jgi:aspartate racemase
VPVLPLAHERALVDAVIMDELVRGIERPASTARLIAVAERMKGEGCDGLILGCTELPLVIGEHNAPLPALDSTRLLARAALAASAGNAEPLAS